MYNFTASPWKTQQTVRNILAEEYSDGPGGLSGNDDAGQMSAWYVFAAIGMYPVDPVSGEHILCSPIFDRVLLQLPGNKKLDIVCHRKLTGDRYIQQMRLNGKPYKKNFISYVDIMKGGVLEIYLQEQPTAWGAASVAHPSGLTLIK
jgi:putative alpha-1,2-mannosidase